MPRERPRMLLRTSSGGWLAGNARLRAAGIMSEADATTINEAMVEAAVALKWQSWPHPPIKRQAPRHCIDLILDGYVEIDSFIPANVGQNCIKHT